MVENFSTKPLTADLANKYINQITKLANDIPKVSYSPEEILAVAKDGRLMLAKWQHSVVIVENEEVIAFIIGYERKAEYNDQYPENTIYISELCVNKKYRRKGLAKQILADYFKFNNKIGFLKLSGRLNYSLQTNSATSNGFVIKLYESFGFTTRAKKEYHNRTDLVMGVASNSIKF
jgi:ribosomal protein S18 acetylase RimI-like enzyme